MRERMRKAGGILTIVGGIIIVAGLFIATGGPWALFPEPTAPPPAVVVAVLIAVGVVAVIGGISALRGKRWGLALAGACCAAFPRTPVGILAIIFISITKREFE